MAQAATRSLKDAIPKVLPSSPFGELLRQSKFASFDPCIRQTYSAPPSYAQKGNFGLKRPISNRKSHAYIVLKDFEEHAQYIEWNNAKGQVKWIKKVEELYVAPQLKTTSPWAYGLGPSATSRESGLDSDFCPGETALVERNNLDGAEERTDQAATAGASAPEHLVDIPLPVAEAPISAETLLPSRGKGGYGARADVQPVDAGKMFLQPTISAMPTAVFKRYREKLRKLRPEFIAFVRGELQKNKKLIPVDPSQISDGNLMAELGPIILDHKFHLQFMGLKTEAEYHTKPVAEAVSEDDRRLEQGALPSANKPQPIRPQPHKYAGLMYAHPTALETHFISKPQPGIYLEYAPNHNNTTERHIASFAGMASQFRHHGVGTKPVFESGSGANLDNLSQGIRLMSPVTLAIAIVPTVVGRAAPSKPMPHVHMRTLVADDAGVSKNQRDNPHTPGTYEYNSLKPVSSEVQLSTYSPDRARTHSWGNSLQAGIRYDFSSKDWQKMRSPGAFDPKSKSPQFRRLDYEKEADSDTLRVVDSMLKRASEKKETNRPE